jgi:hypothetical protein
VSIDYENYQKNYLEKIMKTILKLAFVTGILMTAAPSFAQLYIGLGVRVGPPPPRREVVAVRPPHPGSVWIGGYYRWVPRRHHYIWIRGYWARPPRPHAVWISGRWEERHGEWIYNEGRWEGEHHHKNEHRQDEHPPRVRH